MRPIPYGRQHISEEDIQAVVEVLRSDYLTQGPWVARFEEAFADYVGSEYAVAVANGTAALHLCSLALGVKPGDKVITTPITFAATANCVRYCGGEVVFADIDPQTYLLDILEVRKLLESAPIGTYKGLIPVDFAGRPVDMESFRKLADEFGLWIIEDACHAPGAYFTDSKGVRQKCGNGNYADLAIFSFHPVKHIATGEGGMITTNNRELYEKLLMLRTHGITREKSEFKNPVELAGGVNDYPGWYMEMQELGFNYRLTDFQAALGLSQLKRADIGLLNRIKIANRYNEFMSNNSIINKFPAGISGHAYHLYIIETNERLELYNYLHSNQILAQIHYIPLHLMPYYGKTLQIRGDLPIAEAYYEKCISLPIFPSLTEDEQNFVLNIIKSYA
jgi:UDP-4-amino-4,6-dideoxy-N-acetyl-beta-L-altrosamine transaminase